MASNERGLTWDSGLTTMTTRPPIVPSLASFSTSVSWELSCWHRQSQQVDVVVYSLTTNFTNVQLTDVYIGHSLVNYFSGFSRLIRPCNDIHISGLLTAPVHSCTSYHYDISIHLLSDSNSIQLPVQIIYNGSMQYPAQQLPIPLSVNLCLSTGGPGTTARKPATCKLACKTVSIAFSQQPHAIRVRLMGHKIPVYTVFQKTKPLNFWQ